MMRRSLGAVLWSLVGLLSCFLGALAALLGTGAGRTLLARSLAGTLQHVVAGRVEVGDIGGTLFSGVVLHDVRLFDHDSTLVAFLPRIELTYNPFDFAAGRIVLQDIRLERPQFNLVQHANGRLNLEELLHLGEKKDATAPKGPPQLILLRDVEVVDGSLVLRLQDVASAADSVLEIDEHGADGRRRVRRFENLNLKLVSLRISAPRQPGIRGDIQSLAVDISDPDVRVRDLAGNFTVVGDSMALDLSRVALPASHLAITGRLTWPRGPILYDLDIVADSAALSDFQWIDPRFPADAELRGALLVRSSPPRGAVLTVKLDPVQILHHGGVLTGKVTAISLADSGLVRVRDGDLNAQNVDLELARPFLDTLPFAGRLSGHTVVSGPVDSLSLEVDWEYRDSLVAGWPESRFVGSGIVDLRDAEGIAFRPFALTSSSIDMGTARRLIPALELRGTIDGVGTLDGPYTNVTYDGLLRHHDRAGPTTQLRGRLRLDARHDTLGVSADLVADTLALAGLRTSYPTIPFDVMLAGPIRLEGNIGDLETHADLEEITGGGHARFDGRLVLLFPPLGGRDMNLAASNIDLRAWLGSDAPHSRLNFTLKGDYVSDTMAPPVGGLSLQLGNSTLAGSTVDTGAAIVRFTDGRLIVDSLMARLPSLAVQGEGDLGWQAPVTGRLTLEVQSDSLNELDSLANWLAGTPRAVAESDSLQPLDGAATVRATLAGALDSLTAEGRAEVRRLRWRDLFIPAAEGDGRWESTSRQFVIAAEADSVSQGDLGFGQANARLAGRPDSLSWFVRSRVGDWLAVLAGGDFQRDSSGTTARVDSGAVQLPQEIWVLNHPALVRVTRAGITLPDSGIDLHRAGEEGGTLELRGTLPVEGAGDATLTVRQLPLAALLALAINDTSGARARLDADLALRGTRRDPEFEGSYVITGGPSTDDVPLEGRGSVAYRARRLDAVLRGYRGARRIVDATAHLPLDLGFVPVARRQLPDTLSVRVTADSLDLSKFGLLEAYIAGVHGRFSADFGVRGTWDAPSLTGTAELRDAGAAIRSLNVNYGDLTGRFSFFGDTIRVDSLGLTSGQGRLDVTGYVRLDQLTHPILALDLRAEEFRALDIRNFMSVTATANLAMRGPLIGATVTGRGTVTSGVLYFADLVNKRVVNLDEPWVATLIDPDELKKQQLEVGLHYRILDSLRVRNLNLQMGSDVWLRSNEANIQLTGGVTMSKEARNYILSGTLQAPRGTYRLVVGPVTREFVVTQGTVRYFGTPDLNAELDIQAKHVVHPVASPASQGSMQTEDLTVNARIGGTLFVPRITLSAEGKSLSQTELISFLVFGRSSFELAGEGRFGGDNGVLLQSAAQNFAQVLTGELERKLVSDLGVPLDYLEIDVRPEVGNGSSGVFQSALLAAGWQIGDRTFLTLNAGFCQQQGRQTSVANALGASVQFRISQEWRTELSFEPVRICGLAQTTSQRPNERQFGLDLFWERRY